MSIFFGYSRSCDDTESGHGGQSSLALLLLLVVVVVAVAVAVTVGVVVAAAEDGENGMDEEQEVIVELSWKKMLWMMICHHY